MKSKKNKKNTEFAKFFVTITIVTNSEEANLYGTCEIEESDALTKENEKIIKEYLERLAIFLSYCKYLKFYLKASKLIMTKVPSNSNSLTVLPHSEDKSKFISLESEL
jgi:hypothetical protein